KLGAASIGIWLLVIQNHLAQANVIASPTILTQPFDQTVDYGSNATFTITAAGNPLHYQWQKNGANLADYKNVSGAKTATINLVGVAQSDAASYTVIVFNSGGAVTSIVATLTINSTVVF